MTAPGAVAEAYCRRDRAAHPSGPLAALIAALALLGSGCGASSIAVPELTSFTTAAQTSAAADSARFALQLKMTMPLLGQASSHSAPTAASTRPRQRAELSVDLSSLAETLKSLGSAFGGQMKGDLGDPDDWKLQAIRDGDVAYVYFPLIAEQAPGREEMGEGRRDRSSPVRTRAGSASSAPSPGPTRATCSGC